MKLAKTLALLLAVLATVSVVGCNNNKTIKRIPKPANGGGPDGPFTLAWSEYPSWSVYGVAHEVGLIDKAEGKLGKLEEKWNVDVVLKQLDYEPCLSAFGNGTTDAVCITNMDIVAPSLGRNGIAVLPTSTSAGADACIVTGISSVDELKGTKSYGLENSVSQYMFERALEEMGQDPAEFPFAQMDPAAAAIAMQNKQDGIDSIVVWNPFVMQTLSSRKGEAKVLFDSTKIPEEIVDMVVVGNDAMIKQGGSNFASCIVEAFYEVNKLLESPDSRDETLVELGEKFGALPLEDMKVIVEQTKFYKTPDEGIAIFTNSDFQNDLMPRIIDFCMKKVIIEEKPSVSFTEERAQIRFDTSFMEKVKSGAGPAATP